MFGRKPFLLTIPRYLTVIITIALLAITGVVMYFYTKYQEKYLMVLVVVLTLMFVLSMNTMVSRFAVFKMKAPKYPKGYYEVMSVSTIESNLLKAGFEKTNRQFGEGFIKIEGRTAYKVLLVEKSEKYFGQEKDNNQKPTKGIDKCNKLIGFEIFFENKDEIKKRIPDFSFKGEKILYEGFYLDNEINRLVEANKIETEPHQEEYKRLKEIIGFKEEEYIEEEPKRK